MRNWEEFRKSKLKQLEFGSLEKCLENANVRRESKEICLQCEVTQSDTEVDKCGVALCHRPRIHPTPSQVLGHLFLHTLRLSKWMILMHVRPPALTAQVHLRLQRPPTTEFAPGEEENGVQTILSAIRMRKKNSYPLSFSVWHTRMTF